MPLASILVVDSDSASRAQISGELRSQGHEVDEMTSAGAALDALRTRRRDLMVCDWVLPDLAGIELLSDVRRDSELCSMRVLMTSDRAAPNAAVAALESGADDFVEKPLQMPVFLARVNACLRRTVDPDRSRAVVADGIAVDNVGHRVTAAGHPISLAPREYRLLLFLLRNQDRVFSRRQLLVHVWDREATVGPRTVDVHIRRLRSVFEPYGFDQYFQTVRGSGYRFSLTV